MEKISVKTEAREQLVPLNRQLSALVRDKGWKNGCLLVFCPHTTASIAINESADLDVQRDICWFLNRMVPNDAGFRHFEGNSDSHIKSGLFGPHCMLIVEQGNLCLGTWQEVYFCEWDGPRSRSVWVQFMSSGN